ncbi:MAG: hypothetical protein EA378_08470 [Phycisphaerales bacterium]|nr:MAG: hypothetical protein EA378_08470 [Phycisphaerales bacterium]
MNDRSHREGRAGRRVWRWRVACVAAAGAAAVLVAGCAGSGATAERDDPSSAPAPSFGATQRAAYLESFDEVWRIVRDQHYDENLNGVDWAAAREDLRPRVEAADSADEARGAMSALLGRLGESHFAIIPAEAYRTLDNATDEPEASPETREANGASDDRASSDRASGDGASREESSRERAATSGPRPVGWHGVQVRERDGAFVVTRLEPGSPAEAKGLRTGDVVERIGQSELAPLLEASRRAAESGPSRAETVAAIFAEGRLDGRAGDVRHLTVRGEDGATRELKFELTDEAGRELQMMQLPPMATRFATRDLGGGVAYLTFTAFLDPTRIMPKYTQALETLIDTHADDGALVIDLRGNLGGLMPMVSGMSGWLVDESASFGELRIRGTTLRPRANPQWETFRGPVAVLIDEVSISSAEIMAAGLQDIGRARLFGTRTAGLALPSQFVRLPSGDGLQFVFADYVRSNGVRLESEGVRPDEEIRDRPSSGDPDPVLSAAMAWIQAERARAQGAR